MEVRLDKWLWAARFFRTRQKAIEAVKGGKVHVNGQRSKPSKTVFIQDLIEISFGMSQKIVVIKAISNERKGAKVACELYEETQESIEAREKERNLGIDLLREAFQGCTQENDSKTYPKGEHQPDIKRK